MPSDDEQMGHRIGRKFTRKTHSSTNGAVTQSMLLPIRPTHSDSEDQTDVCKPTNNMPYNLNQSFFQMITGRSGSNMASRFDDDDSDEEDDAESAGAAFLGAGDKGKHKLRNQWTLPPFSRLGSIEEALAIAQKRGDDDDDSETDDRGPAPFMSQILEAQARMNTSVFEAAAIANEEAMFGQDSEAPEKISLAQRLKDIFDLPQLEDVISGKWASLLILAITC